MIWQLLSKLQVHLNMTSNVNRLMKGEALNDCPSGIFDHNSCQREHYTRLHLSCGAVITDHVTRCCDHVIGCCDHVIGCCDHVIGCCDHVTLP